MGLQEPRVWVVERSVEKKGPGEVAPAYLEYLYTPIGQEIIAKNFYRPIDPQTYARHSKQFPNIELFTIDKLFGGWKNAQANFFADGAIFDQIYQPKRATQFPSVSGGAGKSFPGSD